MKSTWRTGCVRYGTGRNRSLAVLRLVTDQVREDRGGAQRKGASPSFLRVSYRSCELTDHVGGRALAGRSVGVEGKAGVGTRCLTGEGSGDGDRDDSDWGGSVGGAKLSGLSGSKDPGGVW